MRIGATGPAPIDSTPPPLDAKRESEGAPAAFSAVLAQRLREPRDRIELTRDAVRSAIADVRSGAALGGGGTTSALAEPTPAPVYARPTGPSGGAGADPFGWRELTRTLGDRVVAPGFGEVFEAQIQQESGFSPEVAFGYRRSSAGAEGIAQLMPQYYQGVDRRNPEASLQAAAETMRHYLSANGGDVRRALASYNAGLGTVQSLVAAHGANWERGLPGETKQYLAAILDGATRTFDTRGAVARAFGGRGPHGVMNVPLPGAQLRGAGHALEWLGQAGDQVLAPADGVVAAVLGDDGAPALRLDHGNGWATLLQGLGALEVGAGEVLRRGQRLGSLAASPAEAAVLRLELSQRGRLVDARPYVIGAAD